MLSPPKLLTPMSKISYSHGNGIAPAETGKDGGYPIRIGHPPWGGYLARPARKRYELPFTG